MGERPVRVAPRRSPVNQTLQVRGGAPSPVLEQSHVADDALDAALQFLDRRRVREANESRRCVERFRLVYAGIVEQPCARSALRADRSRRST